MVSTVLWVAHLGIPQLSASFHRMVHKVWRTRPEPRPATEQAADPQGRSRISWLAFRRRRSSEKLAPPGRATHRIRRAGRGCRPGRPAGRRCGHHVGHGTPAGGTAPLEDPFEAIGCIEVVPIGAGRLQPGLPGPPAGVRPADRRQGPDHAAGRRALPPALRAGAGPGRTADRAPQRGHRLRQRILRRRPGLRGDGVLPRGLAWPTAWPPRVPSRSATWSASGSRSPGSSSWPALDGIVHRDVKPANVLVTRFGEPALADFGIAIVAGEMTGTTQALTPVHAAPEVLESRGAGPAADQWSLASTLHTLLAGRAPFASSDDEGLLPGCCGSSTTRCPSFPAPTCPRRCVRCSPGAWPRIPPERWAAAGDLGRALQEVERGEGWPVTILPIEEVARGPVPPGRGTPRRDGPSSTRVTGRRAPLAVLARDGAHRPQPATAGGPRTTFGRGDSRPVGGICSLRGGPLGRPVGSAPGAPPRTGGPRRRHTVSWRRPSSPPDQVAAGSRCRWPGAAVAPGRPGRQVPFAGTGVRCRASRPSTSPRPAAPSPSSGPVARRSSAASRRGGRGRRRRGAIVVAVALVVGTCSCTRPPAGPRDPPAITPPPSDAHPASSPPSTCTSPPSRPRR